MYKDEGKQEDVDTIWFGFFILIVVLIVIETLAHNIIISSGTLVISSLRDSIGV